MWDILSSIVPLALAYTAPLLIIALGGLFSERSGVVNIGLEGLMGVGAFTAAIIISSSPPSVGGTVIYVGLLGAAVAGGIFSLLHAFASVTMKSDQVVSGTAINILSAAITVFLARTITGSANVAIISGFIKRDIPILHKIPVIGPLMFSNTYITTYIVL
ncbi:MAG: sugar transporter permease, partial [Clostridia bacterium]|nr:sugar transporter permease [Clostridia bacterium]